MTEKAKIMEPVKPKTGSSPPKNSGTLEKLATLTSQLKNLVGENVAAAKHVEEQKLKLKMYLTSGNAIECASKQLQILTKSIETLRACDDNLKNASRELQRMTGNLKDAHHRKEYKDALKSIEEADRSMRSNQDKNNLVVGFVVEDCYDSKVWSLAEHVKGAEDKTGLDEYNSIGREWRSALGSGETANPADIRLPNERIGILERECQE